MGRIHIPYIQGTTVPCDMCIHCCYLGIPLHSCTYTRTHVHVFLSSYISYLMCQCATLCMVCFPGCPGGERREERRKEGEFGEGLWGKAEAMSVGELTKYTVQVTCMMYACTCT